MDDRDPLGGRHMFESLTGRSDPRQWDQLSDVSRLMWEHRAAGRPDFVPSTAEPRHVTQKIVNPMPEPEIPARPAEVAEIPGGAKTIINLAEKHGWNLAITYCRGPWSQQAEHDESDEGDDVLTKFGQADSILVRGWREHRGQRQRFSAMWLRKPWTKKGQEPAKKTGPGGYEPQFIQIRPAPAGQTGASGGTEVGKDGKSHRIPTDLVVNRNGKVSSDELKAFIRAEEIA